MTSSRHLQESPINDGGGGGGGGGGSSSNNNTSNNFSPLTPKAFSRSEPVNNNPYPTTFVQADTSTFKQVVQMLTGSSETAKNASDPPPPPPNKSAAASGGGGFCIPPKKQGFKALYERRNSGLKNGLLIPSNNAGYSPRKPPEMMSPSILDFPSLALSPVTPLNSYSSTPPSTTEEERAIAEKKFYLHPSPRAINNNSSSSSTPRDSEPPQLLPLFPLTSPRVSDC